jgi:hypothetical protein
LRSEENREASHFYNYMTGGALDYDREYRRQSRFEEGME